MSTERVEELKYWLGFNLVRGIGPAKFRKLCQQFGSPGEAWSASELQLQQAGIGQRALQNLIEFRRAVDLEAELERVRSRGITLITWNDEDYPRYLKEITNPPPLIYSQGELLPSDEWAVAVVGTRRLTAYGRQVTQDVVTGLVQNSITIISGLARGIDALAHQRAVEMGGRTIAVLGSGLDRLYPAEHRSLAQRITDGHGAVVTDYPLDTPPEGGNFPARNRIVSGLALGVVVVEAGIRSGALITAGFALEQDRDVFAVPGNINSPASAGTNRLIQQGAKLVQRSEDILEELNLTMVPQQLAAQKIAPDTAEEALLVNYLSDQPIHIDEIINKVELPSGLVGSTLTLMELKGLVRQVGGMNYVLAREPMPEYIINRASIEEDI
jgi:DNA processing protein